MSKVEFEYFVEIREIATRKVARTLGPFASERQAERADRGVSINLDHTKFFTHDTKKRKPKEPK